jgi:hypothetical protein
LGTNDYIADSINTKVSVIQFPDSAGVSCGFSYQNFRIPKSLNDYGIAFINYDLGVLENSPCDTLGSIGVVEVEAATKKIITKNYGNILTIYHHENLPISVGLYDIQGKLLHTYAPSLYHTINLNNYAAGMYFLQISNEYDELIETLKANAVR